MPRKKAAPKRSARSSQNDIIVHGARVHNLKNVDVTIPRNKLAVITGLSGSGKSSLAFDTIYAEGNRRYMESLSAYARTLLDVNAKPDVDKIENLSPSIAIDQKSVMRSPRSTIGTMTEIYDYLRVLFARVGTVVCPDCNVVMQKTSPEKIYATITAMPEKAQCVILAPLSEKGKSASELLQSVQQMGYARVRFNGKIMPVAEALLIVDDTVVTSVDVVIDRMTVDHKNLDRERIMDSVETALRLSKGSVIIAHDDVEERFNRDFKCTDCDTVTADITPRHFSFNNPEGACTECSGLGQKAEIDPTLLIPNKKLSLAEGAIRIWGKVGAKAHLNNQAIAALEDVAAEYGFELTTPISKLTKAQLQVIFYGVPEENLVEPKKTVDGPQQARRFVGVVADLERKYHESRSEHICAEIEKYMTVRTCPSCDGKRLKRGYLSVFLNDHSIDDVVRLSLTDCKTFLNALIEKGNFSEQQQTIARPLISEMVGRLQSLEDVGVGYLSLHRSTETISGGEAQRIRLAIQIKAELMGMIYVLDEPSVGLHPRDTKRLIGTLEALRDSGNSLIVVEHDADIMRAAEHIIDIGPGAGDEGGEILFSGTYAKLAKAKSPTAGYLTGDKTVSEKKTYRKGSKKQIEIVGATEHNLKDVSVGIPLEKFVVVAGVSGGGKSTLVHDILSRALSKHFYGANTQPGAHTKIKGLSQINKVISIDQKPIGRTPRSNAATYTGVFNHIRDLFAQTEESQERGYTATQFSFNMRGGRCEVCQGDGLKKVEMHLMPDMYVPCEACSGTRYSAKTLEIEYNGANIADVLQMSVVHAMHFFKQQKPIAEKLAIMNEVGLGYLRLGQSAPNLSGGEAQRIKLATELSRKSTGKTLYILDEPTSGLHFEDTKRLLTVLDALVDKGNTVLVVEHNTDVINHGDWVIELGPEGGDGGGEVIFEGTPKKLKGNKKSPTAAFL